MKDFSLLHASILILDSHRLMRAILREALQSAGYLVIAAGDIGSAVDRLKEVTPHLLIVRPYIDSMSGYTAADYLRSRCPGLPVLMVGGFMEDDRINVENAVRELYTFPKPFTRDELLAKVRDVLNYESQKLETAPREAA